MNGLSFKFFFYVISMTFSFFSEIFDEHICDLCEVFDRLQKAGLKCSPHKCKFAQRKCILLGHEVSKDDDV